MNKTELKNILASEYDRSSWIELLKIVFKTGQVFVDPAQANLPKNKTNSAFQLGTFKTSDDYEIAIFEVEVDESIDLYRNRVGVRNLLQKYYKRVDGIFAVFTQGKRFRFSFISQLYVWDEDEGKWVENETEPKRFTYVLGQGETVRTPTQRFLKLTKSKEVSFHDIKEAFSVEALNREFFKKYKEHYNKFWKFLASEDSGYRGSLVNKSKESESDRTKPIRDFVKKLLGQIVFLHFLQKKGWMGCPKDSQKWGNGEKKFMQLLYKNFENKDHFYSQCLTQLFYETLNTKRENDVFSVEGLKGIPNNTRIPYLNGGLFDPEKNDAILNIDFPDEYFEDLLNFFEHYNFTIDENSPDDQEIGIDPEMLGHIFENLLEENRDKGAFYTPKEIVQYMCKESLIEYLQNDFSTKKDIEEFIRFHDVSDKLGQSKNASLINQRLDEIRACDPAIGSGAFPIGMLQEIYKAKRFIYPYLSSNHEFDPAAVKKNIIQNSIYGVDIEKGAVDIAQLRFWLSLVVEEIEPEPLPNLDYKIMQGDSLLEQYEGIELGRIAFTDSEVTVFDSQADMFSGTADEPQLQYDFSEEDRANIKDLLSDYFKEEDKNEKAKIHKRIDQLVIEHIDKSLEFFENKLHIKIAEWEEKLNKKVESLSGTKKKQYKKGSKEQKEIKKLKDKLKKKSEAREQLLKFEETEERPYFLWHLFYMNVFEQGGFDIMIGNPPYIQLQSIREEADKYEKADYDTFRRTGDIYCLFYEQGFNLLKDGGVLTYITSNKWMRGGYGKVLREYFTTVNSQKVINLGPNVFKSATVDTNIYIGKKEPFQNEVKGYKINNRDQLKNLKDDDLIPMQDVDEEAWVVLDEDELVIDKAFKSFGKPLLEWELKINFGIKTGCNQAFKIDQEKRDELVDKDPKAKEIIKPLLRGRDIERYKAEWDGQYLINTHNGVKDLNIPRIDVEEYPSIKEHLKSEKHWESVSNRYDQGDTPFNLRNCTYVKDFKKEKIIWKRIGSIMRFAYSDEEIYCLDSTCIATGEKIKYLTAVLNSKAGLYQLFKSSPQTGTGDQIISNQALEPFLAPYPSEEIEQKFNNLVDIILFIKSWDKSDKERIIEALSDETISSLFEDVVDHMVYELYFEEHMKQKDIDILQIIDFPILADIETEEEKRKTIWDLYNQLRKKENPIRNRMLLAFTRSPNVIKKINDTVVQ
ncbi:hypothetical protein G3570_00755 [Balneolaceae bacterium YR4-1]|uniref:site-specific DNA-methyltransferase (adenine-specific) n=1 Tax=Halalkalibaculum roseum TaxID=2709311 RepID=A0A6M1SVY7_9BACT|nr:TaqI-like C-terminal specificity domain-containing protein [Halalkalibaculum roseum]NGP75144.1 hypothetical protein [Halalkalibaculum roseum]